MLLHSGLDSQTIRQSFQGPGPLPRLDGPLSPPALPVLLHLQTLGKDQQSGGEDRSEELSNINESPSETVGEQRSAEIVTETAPAPGQNTAGRKKVVFQTQS